ncbi:hypothetical protein ACFSAV_07340 [Pasteurella oralis]|uniref:Uncharacterized protein n=1 Tax=Pasteurella oralis TaxID=1071947 RepID=A0ABW4NV84_9PAST
MKVVIIVIEAEENKNKLPEEVKEQIFQTVLESASRSTSFLPEELAASLIEAYKKINLS